MSDIKCPFCQQEYIITKDDFCFGQQRCVCRNPNCEFDGWHFPVKLVSELIRAKNKLDIAVDKLKGIKAYYDDSYADPHTFVNWHLVAQRLANDADDAIKAITALEQKD